MITEIALVLMVLAGAVGMILLVRWARRGDKAAVLAAAALFGFIADPTAERQIRRVQESKRRKAAEDPSGDPPEA